MSIQRTMFKDVESEEIIEMGASWPEIYIPNKIFMGFRSGGVKAELSVN